jgi:PPOX class probable F420-dependent enzyme
LKKSFSQLAESAAVRKLLRGSRVARLGTLNEDGTTHIVPIVFARSSRYLYFAVDKKTKRTKNLRRLQNIRRSGHATVLVDNYSENWGNLSFVMIYTSARVLGEKDLAESKQALKLLGRKYRQYSSGAYLSGDAKDIPVVRLMPVKLVYWSQKLR